MYVATSIWLARLSVSVGGILAAAASARAVANPSSAGVVWLRLVRCIVAPYDTMYCSGAELVQGFLQPSAKINPMERRTGY
jgi:hypothetical protein